MEVFDCNLAVCKICFINSQSGLFDRLVELKRSHVPSPQIRLFNNVLTSVLCNRELLRLGPRECVFSVYICMYDKIVLQLNPVHSDIKSKIRDKKHLTIPWKIKMGFMCRLCRATIHGTGLLFIPRNGKRAVFKCCVRVGKTNVSREHVIFVGNLPRRLTIMIIYHLASFPVSIRAGFVHFFLSSAFKWIFFPSEQTAPIISVPYILDWILFYTRPAYVRVFVEKLRLVYYLFRSVGGRNVCRQK